MFKPVVIAVIILAFLTVTVCSYKAGYNDAKKELNNCSNK